MVRAHLERTEVGGADGVRRRVGRERRAVHLVSYVPGRAWELVEVAGVGGGFVEVRRLTEGRARASCTDATSDRYAASAALSASVGATP